MKLIGIKSGKNNKSGQNFGGCTGTGTGVYRYRPTECNLYRYRSRVYQYRCAQNAQNAVFLYN